MKKPKPSLPSPVDHPNAYAGGSAGLATALVIYEAKNRLGVDINGLEASSIVAVVSYFVLLLGKKAGLK